MQVKKVYFMVGKLWTDLKAWSREVPIHLEVQGSTLGHYYIRFIENPKRLNRLIAGFDPQGIPLNTTYIDVAEKRLHYYPISIGQYALALFHTWLDHKDPQKKAHFLRIAEWFYQHRIEEEQLGAYWLTDIPKPEFQVRDPWKSAFSQSRGISVLLRAWQLTGNTEYYRVAARALIPFTRDISEGGVSVDREQNAPFYEEYVAAYPTRILDGHFFALFGLYDFVRAVPKDDAPDDYQRAKQLFEEGISGLKKQLPLFDMGFWLRFNRCAVPGYPPDDPCTIGYLKLVIAQLKIIHQITGDLFFGTFAQHLETYLRPVNVLRMYQFKASALKRLNRL